MNPHITRVVLTSPFWFPMLFAASMMDFLFFPHYRKLGCDPAKTVADKAFEVMGV